MPIGTIRTETERFPLKSAPLDPNIPGDEDGFILARPLPYGMKLERRDKSTRMRMEQTIQRNRKAKSINQSEPETQTIEIESESTWAANYDFAYCIVDHNLTDPNGNKLDFANPMAVKTLNPKIGSEIESILAELNGDDIDEATIEDFISAPSPSSLEDTEQKASNGQLSESNLSPIGSE